MSWFEETLALNPYVRTKVQVKERLLDTKSSHQHIQVFETVGFGRMLVLDGVIQLTERDEQGYHEMIAHPALCVHPDPKRVCIVGGGDCGTLREVLRHQVSEVHLCELDKEVIEVSRQYFPKLAVSLDDSRVTVYTEDGSGFLTRNKGYDVIIVDSSDPIGPAEPLFTETFYQRLHAALNPDGIAVLQAESIFYHLAVIRPLFKQLRKLFPVAAYYQTHVPTYPSGMIGFAFCSRKHSPRDVDRDRIPPGLAYYTAEAHAAAFVLPGFAADLV